MTTMTEAPMCEQDDVPVREYGDIALYLIDDGERWCYAARSAADALREHLTTYDGAEALRMDVTNDPAGEAVSITRVPPAVRVVIGLEDAPEADEFGPAFDIEDRTEDGEAWPWRASSTAAEWAEHYRTGVEKFGALQVYSSVH